MRIFGREPVYVLAFLAVALKLAAAFGLDVTAEQQTLINTVLSCVVAIASAVVLQNGALGAAILQFASAAMALFVGFGLDWSAEKQGLVMASVAALLAIVEHREVQAPLSQVPLEQSSPLKPRPPQGV